MPDIPANVLADAAVLWEYHAFRQRRRQRYDLLLVLGSHDGNVAERAADLYREISPSLTVVSGGLGKVTKHTQAIPEAERFKQIMMSCGVPGSAILLEPEGTNTGENIVKTHDLLDAIGVTPETGLLVTKPYMMRRAIATAEKQWDGVQWDVEAPLLSLESYLSNDEVATRTINLMVGDLQRIDVYAGLGFQTYQEIPDDVWTAFHRLVDAGYDSQVHRKL